MNNSEYLKLRSFNPTRITESAEDQKEVLLVSLTQVALSAPAFEVGKISCEYLKGADAELKLCHRSRLVFIQTSEPCRVCINRRRT